MQTNTAKLFTSKSFELVNKQLNAAAKFTFFNISANTIRLNKTSKLNLL